VRSLLIADCQFPIADLDCVSAEKQIGNWQSETGKITTETPNRGQSAKRPDRYFAKAINSLIKFFGSNASALNTPLN
jgi:hypothetical protein